MYENISLLNITQNETGKFEVAEVRLQEKVCRAVGLLNDISIITE